MSAGTNRLRVLIQGVKGDQFRAAITEDVEISLTPSLRDEDVAPLLANADVWIATKFTAGMSPSTGNLKLIQTPGAGTNGIDFSAVPPDTVVCNAVGHQTSLAEYIIMATLALHRDLFGMDRNIRNGDWRDKFQASPKPGLRGRTIGIIGAGRIGAEVARLAHAFGLRVIGVTKNPDPSRAEKLGFEFMGSPSDLHHVLEASDVVAVTVPLDDSTQGMIGTNELARMREDAYLINVSRGPVVDECALFETLKQKRIAGAAIDVWYQYPASGEQVLPSKLPFHELDNVIMTPHTAGWTDSTFQQRWEQINANLRNLSAGVPLLNVVYGIEQ